MKKLFRLLIVTLFLSAFALGQAQEKVLYAFAGSPDGATPVGKLVADSAGNLYGTTSAGGVTPYCEGCGTVFELSQNADGTYTESILYDFCQNAPCSDGWSPRAGLVFDGAGNLYGTTLSGGGLCWQGGSCGTVFELSPPQSSGLPWVFTQLYQFCQLPGQDTCPDGALPVSTLAFDASGNLYGTTTSSSTDGGTVFELSHGINGWTESVIYTFCSQGKAPHCPDGWYPKAGVNFDSSGNIYGTTRSGGSSKYEGAGVVYKLSKSGATWSETILHAFISDGPNGGEPTGEVNFDAAGNLYSTTSYGGTDDFGVVFRLTAKTGAEQSVSLEPIDGAEPLAGVLIDPVSGDLYGTASTDFNWGGPGEVYRVANGKLSVVWGFGGYDGDGADPEGALIVDHGALYGTTAQGGNVTSSCEFGCGTVFEITK